MYIKCIYIISYNHHNSDSFYIYQYIIFVYHTGILLRLSAWLKEWRPRYFTLYGRYINYIYTIEYTTIYVLLYMWYMISSILHTTPFFINMCRWGKRIYTV